MWSFSSSDIGFPQSILILSLAFTLLFFAYLMTVVVAMELNENSKDSNSTSFSLILPQIIISSFAYLLLYNG